MDYNTLEAFRDQIDNIDNEIMILLKRRMQFAKKIAKYKHKKGLEIFVQQREDEILLKVRTIAITMNLSESFVRNLFQLIMDESKREQVDFMDKEDKKAQKLK